MANKATTNKGIPKAWLAAGGVVLVVVIIAAWWFGTYNMLVSMDQSIQGQWAQVESQYQRRADLIPNLVSTAKGYMQFEASLLQNITALRSQWVASATVDDKIKYGTALDSAIGRLIAVYENYPELKAIQAISGLMDELAGTENRIAVERMRYNSVVQSYNTAVRSVPTSFIANAYGFAQKPFFEAIAGAENAPTVKF